MDDKTVFLRSYRHNGSMREARSKFAQWILADVCWQDPKLFPFVEGQLSHLGAWSGDSERPPLFWPPLLAVKLPKASRCEIFRGVSQHEYKSLHLPDNGFIGAHWFADPRVMLVHTVRKSFVLLPDMSQFVPFKVSKDDLAWCLLGMGGFDLRTGNGATHLNFNMKFLGEEQVVSLTGSKDPGNSLASQALKCFANFAAGVFQEHSAWAPPGGWKKTARGWRD